MSDAIKVLVLDDEKIVCERLHSYLEDKGVEVESFSDSSQAIERIEEKHFDVVITDLKMAGYTGLDVLNIIKQKRPVTKGILITAYGDLEKFHEAKALDVFEIIHKPFQMSDIYKKVKKAAKQASKNKAKI